MPLSHGQVGFKLVAIQSAPEKGPCIHRHVMTIESTHSLQVATCLDTHYLASEANPSRPFHAYFFCFFTKWLIDEDDYAQTLINCATLFHFGR